MKQIRITAFMSACFLALLASPAAVRAQLGPQNFTAATAVPPIALQSSSGTPSSTTVYYGDGHWAAPAAAAAASASVSTDYIFGLALSYSSSGSYGSVVVGTGTCYCPAASTGAITATGAGTTSYNSTYNQIDSTDYTQGSASTTGTPEIRWNTSQWVFGLYGEGGPYAYLSSGGQTLSSGPAGTYTAYNGNGTAPAPTATSSATSAAGVYTLSSAYTYTPTAALTASTFYYLYLGSSGTFTVSNTVPTLYQGTARSSGYGRYIGCFLTTASGAITNFQQIGDRTRYRVNTAAAPFRVVLASAVTTATTQSCSAVVPPTATMATVWLSNTGSAVAYLGTSDGVVPTATTGETAVALSQTEDISLDASQSFSYIGGTLAADVEGFIERR